MATFVNDFFRLPPEGTGKRVMAPVYITLGYVGLTGTFSVNDVVTGEISGAEGEVLDSEAITPTTGHLYLKVDHEESTLSFSAGENLKIDGITQAQADDAGIPTYVQAFTLSGANNPYYNKQFVDRHGAAYVRFDEGPQQLDAFGLTRTSSPVQIDDYSHEYGHDPDIMQTTVSGTGSMVILSDESAVRFDIGTASGDQITHSTHRYHLYQTGYSQLSEMTVACGDTGKTGVRRRWGYFDGYDGLFFQLDGTAFSVVKRSSVTGTPVDTEIAQADFNVDKADGAGEADNLSRLDIDVSKVNLYWIDFQWLGAGRVRFGVYSRGERVVLHEFYEGNSGSTPYMKTGILPLRWEITNTATTVSPSSLKLISATVKTEGDVRPDFQKRTKKHSFVGTQVTNIGGSQSYLASSRSADLFNGETNRKISIPEFFHVNVQDSPIILRVHKDMELVGDSFVAYQDSAAEIDDGYATSFSGGRHVISYFLDAGSHNLDVPSNFGYLGEHMRLLADGSYGDTYTFTAEKIGAGPNASVIFGMTWIDMG